MRNLVLAAMGFGLAAATLTLDVSPARADGAWCAIYRGSGGGGTNCGFYTIEQCRAAISGVGGSCTPNLLFAPRAEAPRAYLHKPVVKHRRAVKVRRDY